MKNAFYVTILFFLWTHFLPATFVCFFEEQPLDNQLKEKIFDLLLRGEPPRSFYNAMPIELESECRKIIPSIQLEWIPSSVWQMVVLHAFFHDKEIREGILKCSREYWNPIDYEQEIHQLLPDLQTFEQIAGCFDRQTLTIPDLCNLFFKVNHAVGTLFKRANGSDIDMLRLIIAELPSFDELKKSPFPFLNNPWNDDLNPHSLQNFYEGLMDEKMLSKIAKIERTAYDNGEWVLYRGYDGFEYPTTLQLEEKGNHALSFGSTLLGGAFYSLEAAALTYSKTENDKKSHHFLALKISPKEINDVFRIGPLHPFVQMLVDGEMFHAHTKVAASKEDDYQEKVLNGYFMRINKHCKDPIGYILTLKLTAEELEKYFQKLCERSGYFLNWELEKACKCK